MSKTAWYRRRWLKIALVAAVATLTGMRIGVTLWGRSHLAKFVTATAPLWDGERARLEALRNPLDPSAKEPCATAYFAAGVDLGASGRAIGMALLGSPRDKVPEDARAIVAAERGAIDGFLRAAKCGGYAPKPAEAWITYGRLYPFFAAGRLVIVDARMRAEAGDIDAALDRLLAATKAGTDLGEGTLMAGVHGAAVSTPALETLAMLVAEGRLSVEQQARVKRTLEALGPRMPTIVHGVIKERLRLHAIAVAVQTTGVAPPDATPGPDDPARFVAKVLPARAVLADALTKQERFMTTVQEFAATERDPLLFLTLLANAEPRAASRRLAGFDFPPYGLTQKGHHLCLPRAWQRMMLEALAIEKAGVVPSALPAPIDDPCGAGQLLYIPGTGGRYTLESVGNDGAVSMDDLRLDRVPSPAPTPGL